MQCSKQAVALQLHESWFREYQVLPSRTHPHMTTSATGGYVLSGMKVKLETGPAPKRGENGRGGHQGAGKRRRR